MSQEQITEHVFRLMEGDMWCLYCGFPKEAHLFKTAEELEKFNAVPPAPEQR